MKGGTNNLDVEKLPPSEFTSLIIADPRTVIEISIEGLQE